MSGIREEHKALCDKALAFLALPTLSEIMLKVYVDKLDKIRTDGDGTPEERKAIASYLEQGIKTEIPEDLRLRAEHILFERLVSEDETSPNGKTATTQRVNTEPRRLTDMGNAERLIDQHGSRLLYCDTWGKWLVWDGLRWALDETQTVRRLAKQTVRSIYTEASDEKDPDKRTAIAKHAVKSEHTARIAGMVREAQPDVPILPDDLDGDPMLLNCQNGTLDLNTGLLRAHAQGDYITKLVPVDYDPQAKCPLFLAFLDRIMDGNKGMVEFLQRAAGYSLTGSTSEQCFFIPHGNGDNGKSTLLTVLGDLMSDYAKQAAAESLMVKRSQNVPEDIARLRGARFVSASETEVGRRLAEGLIKQVTGGDRLTARYLYNGSFEFLPEFKLWLATNHKPNIKGTDHAIWRRIRLIPFNVKIPEGEKDKDLPQKLREELPGILAWAVRGCLAWKRDGLNSPQEVTQATQAYRDEMDVIGSFLADRCVIGTQLQVRAKDLYTSYSEWCDDNGERAITGTSFGRAMSERGLEKDRDLKGYIYVGIGLLGD